MTDDLTYEVAAMADIPIEGNIIPAEWLTSIKMETGKTDSISVLILSDIVYWYRPIIIRDEQSGRILGRRKKFRADLLQRSYTDLENLFGFSRSQIKDSLQRLEKRGLILRVFRNIFTNGTTLTNVMFIKLFPEEVRKLTCKNGMGILPHTYGDKSSYPITSIPTPVETNRQTYTETTTEISKTSFSLGKDQISKQEREMIEIWDKIIRQGEGSTKLPKQKYKMLTKMLERHFDGKIDNWAAYCQKITTSKFLMGQVNAFKASLDWALKEESIIKIQNGDYGVGEWKIASSTNSNNQTYSEKETIAFLKEDQVCKELRSKILEEIGIASYKAWFSRVNMFLTEESGLEIKTPTRFIESYIRDNYISKIEKMCNEININYINVIALKTETA